MKMTIEQLINVLKTFRKWHCVEAFGNFFPDFTPEEVIPAFVKAFGASSKEVKYAKDWYGIRDN
jgi:hypothetical protein